MEDFAGSYKRPLRKETNYTQPMSLDAKVANVGSCLMLAAVSFHKLHLSIKGTSAHAAHVALKEFYDALPDMADTLIESYQGAVEKIIDCNDDVSPKILYSVEDALYYLRELYQKINDLQAELPYSEIVNDLDLVKSSINSLKYKLNFLK
jgi:DNA-binding ferritin-like protein